MPISVLKLLVLGLLLSTMLACNSNDDSRQKQKKAHHTANGFKNLYVEDSDKNFFDFLKMRLLGEEQWADHPSLAAQVPQQKVDILAIQQPPAKVQITWLGHSMFLIQYKGINVLTDPIFTERASPIAFAGPKRYIPHAMDYQQLPPIDLIIISHNHYDHLDNDTLVQLAGVSEQQNSPTVFYVPLGLKAHLVSLDINTQDIVEMDWWDKAVYPNAYANVDMQAMPSQHWSARGLSDRLSTLWASWHIKIDDFSLWFAGDTGYNDRQFKQIGDYIDEIDLALIPIGAYEPRWFMQKYHVDPKEALLIHNDVKAKRSIGMHWGTFPLTAEEPGEPPKVLAKAMQEINMPRELFSTMAVGQTLQLD